MTETDDAWVSRARGGVCRSDVSDVGRNGNTGLEGGYAMIALFTDFGADDIYVGQLKAALLRHAAAGTTIIDVLHTAPNYDPRAGPHLLAALQRALVQNSADIEKRRIRRYLTERKGLPSKQRAQWYL
jgi:hypothetical protein